MAATSLFGISSAKFIVFILLCFLYSCTYNQTCDCKSLTGSWKSQKIIEDQKNQSEILNNFDSKFINVVLKTRVNYVFTQNGKLINQIKDTIGTYRISNCDTLFIRKFQWNIKDTFLITKLSATDLVLKGNGFIYNFSKIP